MLAAAALRSTRQGELTVRHWKGDPQWSEFPEKLCPLGLSPQSLVSFFIEDMLMYCRSFFLARETEASVAEDRGVSDTEAGYFIHTSK